MRSQGSQSILRNGHCTAAMHGDAAESASQVLAGVVVDGSQPLAGDTSMNRWHVACSTGNVQVASQPPGTTYSVAASVGSTLLRHIDCSARHIVVVALWVVAQSYVLVIAPRRRDPHLVT